jgi:hypothetical protein
MKAVPGSIDFEDFEKIIPEIARLEALPAELSLKVGDEFSDKSFKVIAYDSNDRILGRIPFFDMRVMSASVRMSGLDKYKAIEPCETTIRFSLPGFRSLNNMVPPVFANAKITVVTN